MKIVQGTRIIESVTLKFSPTTKRMTKYEKEIHSLFISFVFPGSENHVFG